MIPLKLKMNNPMKHTTLFFSIVASCFITIVSAQKPFKEIGKDNEVDILTVSNGRYVEYFADEKLRQIGSVMFNTETHKIEYFIPQDDTAHQKVIARTKEASRWMSIDPLASKYPGISPYTFVLDNPILFVDPDGRDVYINGIDAGKAVAALQTKTSLSLSYDTKTGQLTAMGKPSSNLDKELLSAIGDHGIKVNLNTTREDNFKSKDGSIQPVTMGGYDGSVKRTDGIVETTQYINMQQSEKAETAGVSNQGSDVFHEAIESYYGAQNDPGGTYDPTKFEASHNKALAADPSASELNLNLNSKNGQAGLINAKTGKTADLRPMTKEEKKASEKK